MHIHKNIEVVRTSPCLTIFLAPPRPHPSTPLPPRPCQVGLGKLYGALSSARTIFRMQGTLEALWEVKHVPGADGWEHPWIRPLTRYREGRGGFSVCFFTGVSCGFGRREVFFFLVCVAGSQQCLRATLATVPTLSMSKWMSARPSVSVHRNRESKSIH